MVRNIKYDTYSLSKELGVSETVAKLLVNRGIYIKEDAKKFLKSTIDDLYNPKELKDMEKAIDIVRNSILNNEKILIVGDYDVDGVISSYILYKGISYLDANIDYHIPDRILEGYGINESIIRKAKADGVDTIITCDNGISAIEQVKLARELGLKVIITDHHDIPFIETNDGKREYIVPEANAVINPKQKDCPYLFDKLCGAAVAFKFIQEVHRQCAINEQNTIELIQYVAIATVCDVVDLVGENRIFVKKGLELINRTSNIGLKALFKETGLDNKEINVHSLGFVVGPSINASGRLEQATWALKMLLTQDEKEAEELAKKLHALNQERQDLTKVGLDNAIEIIEENKMMENKVLVVYLESIHESIAGIIAGRIREKYNLPAIVLTKAHDGAKGSGRSIEEYNMFEELLKCKELLGKFGGHPMAAGLSIQTENIDIFRKKLNEITTLTEEEVIPKVSIDMPLNLENINYNLIDEIKLLEPYGKGNLRPTFAVKGITVRGANILGKNNNVLKLRLNSNNLYIDGIYFGDIEIFENKIKSFYGEEEYSKLFSGSSNKVSLDLVYYPEINEYMGNKKIQLIIQSYRINEK